MKSALKFLFYFIAVVGIILVVQWSLTTERRDLIYFIVGIPASIFLFAGDLILMKLLGNNSKKSAR